MFLREALCTLVRTKLDCQILSVRPFVRSFVLRKIITFWEGDMRVVRIHLPTGSLKLGFLASPENIRLNFD